MPYRFLILYWFFFTYSELIWFIDDLIHEYEEKGQKMYWVTYKLPQICTEILRIRIGKVARFAVYIYGNFWGTLYKKANEFDKKKHIFLKEKQFFSTIGFFCILL